MGEVEEVWVLGPGVGAAVVVVGEGGRWVGYVVPEVGVRVDPGVVVEFAGSVLPGGVVPSVVVVLGELPVTASGKVDRAALPAPDVARGPHRAPRTATEETLASVFAEVLGVDQVGLDESFFALGGDSIMSIQLVARAKAAGLILSPRDVFERRTVAGLAEVAHYERADAVVLEELPGGGVGPVPLTPVVA
ncbi:phosphopantetheine-binding protein, partial [Streptomyces sp. NPDC127092]|uniref:phosphopantetheine-binding protein n=1 Tax=Streptomyces sp. NPDC127092 TaxID=3347135 RepID=UPI003654E47B